MPTVAYQPSGWRGAFHTRESDDGVHALLIAPDAQHRLWMPRPIAVGAAVACAIPLGSGAAFNTAAVLQFWRHITGGRTPQRRLDGRLKRAQLSLWALDQHDAGASYRALAEQMFGLARVTAESWRTSPLRDSTIRLVRTGAALVAGDYRRLLRPPRDEQGW